MALWPEKALAFEGGLVALLMSKRIVVFFVLGLLFTVLSNRWALKAARGE
jgi:hypothetical protein